MMQHIEIGGSPGEEDCAQVGSKRYDAQALMKLECRCYIEALKRKFGEPPEGAKFVVHANPHDLGTYYEVRIVFDVDSGEHHHYAEKVQDGLATWDEGRSWPPVTYDHFGDAVNILREPWMWSIDDNPICPRSTDTKPAS